MKQYRHDSEQVQKLTFGIMSAKKKKQTPTSQSIAKFNPGLHTLYGIFGVMICAGVLVSISYASFGLIRPLTEQLRHQINHADQLQAQKDIFVQDITSLENKAQEYKEVQLRLLSDLPSLTEQKYAFEQLVTLFERAAFAVPQLDITHVTDPADSDSLLARLPNTVGVTHLFIDALIGFETWIDMKPTLKAVMPHLIIQQETLILSDRIDEKGTPLLMLNVHFISPFIQ